MLIRPAIRTDLPQIRSLFETTVKAINARDYDEQQIEAWSARAQDTVLWERRFTGQHMFVSEREELITGFSSITPTGYLDCLFVHRDFQSAGIATALFQAAKDCVAGLGCEEITADVSITARPFFERMGFEMVREQQVSIGAIVFTNFQMALRLD